MMKVLTPTHGLTLLALAVALTGCPGLETGAKNDPKPDPQPSASAPADETEEEPTLTVKALGPVRATLQGAPEVAHGPFTLHWSSFSGLSELGYLIPYNTQPPSDAGLTNRTYRENPAGVFDPDGSPKTHAFYYFGSTQNRLAKLDASQFAMGEVAPTGFRNTGHRLELDFPGGTTGTLRLTLPEDDDLHFRRPGNDGKDSFQRSLDITPNSGVRSATVSVTVAVTELDGTPSEGLGAANFQVPESSAIQVKETAPGVYRVSIGFDELYGLEPEAQSLELSVTHASLTHTHKKETP